MSAEGRVLVCGGRDYADWGTLDSVLDLVNPAVVIHGAARGADSLAGRWAREMHGVTEEAFPADWDKHGKSAGPIRNQRMLDDGKPDMVVAFPGGAGTADMVRRSRAAGILVLRVEP